MTACAEPPLSCPTHSLIVTVGGTLTATGTWVSMPPMACRIAPEVRKTRSRMLRYTSFSTSDVSVGELPFVCQTRCRLISQ